MDVGQEEVAGVADDAHVVLDVQGELEIVAPVAALVAVVGQDRVVEEDAAGRRSRRAGGRAR